MNDVRIPVEYVAIVRDRASCGMADARNALAARALCIPCSIEYVTRTGLAAVASDAARYPRWTRHQKNGH